MAPWGHGKCFVEGQLVDTFFGLLPIEKVRAGNKVYSYNFEDGKASYQSLLKDAFFSGEQQCYEIEFAHGQKQKVSFNHPFWLNGRGWIEARYLKIGDPCLAILNYDHKDGIMEINYDDAWVCGLYVGDGSYGKISCGDDIIIDELKTLGPLKKVGPYEYYLKGIRDIVRSLNIDPDSPKSFPVELFKCSGEAISHFIAGYFDADGTISAISRSRNLRGTTIQMAVELYSINRDWLINIQNLLHYFGIRSSVSLKNGKYKGDRHESWRLTIRNKNDLARFRQHIPLRGEKKIKIESLELPEVSKESFYFNEVKSIKDLGVLATYGIEVPVNHNHVFHGILSHNTENAIIGGALDEIGQNPNTRIFIISNTDENAKARIESITNYIKNDKDYHIVYPHVRPADEGSWSKHKIIVDRESRSKDGTVEAWGVTTSGVGGRCDFLFFDDPVDMRNAITNPALREQTKNNIENVWLSRLTPDGMAVYIATIWHQHDATSMMMKNPAWKFLVMRISENFDCIECESPFKGKYKIPLWDYWNRKRLIERYRVIGQRAFNRGFRQQALSDEDRTFPSSDKIFRRDVGLDIVQPSWARCMGIDPFGQQVVLFTMAINPYNHIRFPIEILRGKWSPARTVEEIVSAYERHQHQIIVCENNAAQEAIVQWAMEKGKADMPIMPFTTGKQKADPAMGLPSLEVEFSNGAWCVPCASIDETDGDHPINVWKRELQEHPLGEAADTVMASWFAREGARYLIGGGSSVPDFVTGEEVGIEQVQIGNY